MNPIRRFTFQMTLVTKLSWLIALLGVASGFRASACADSLPSIAIAADGTVATVASDNGDQVPDFSFCGYSANSEAIPYVVPVVRIEPSGADDTETIQSALNEVTERARSLGDGLNTRMWRGAVLLLPGTFKVSKTLYLRGDHVVLRGSVDEQGLSSEIRMVSKSRRPAIIVGSDSYDTPLVPNIDTPSVSRLITEYVPIGSMQVRLDNAEGLTQGNVVCITHPSSQQWIDHIGMRSFPNDDGKGSWLNWKNNTMNQTWSREIVAVQGNLVRLDAPITSSIDPELTRGTLSVHAQSRNHHLGIENLRLVSQADTSFNPLDEEHAWDAIRFSSVTDAWARNLSFTNFCGSAVQIAADARRVTVSDCDSQRPISEQAGGRRHTYFCLGQQALFLRCTAEHGRHDFATGPLTSGPNAFVYCSAKNASRFSGPVGSWATGVLFDNVEVDGHGIHLTNRETEQSGCGWSAVNCVLWNCVAPQIVCRRPPTGFNIAIGIWGEVAGDGLWRSLNEFVSPASLFESQLSQRLGKAKSKQALVSLSQFEFRKLDEKLEGLPKYSAIAKREPVTEAIGRENRKLALTNGWLTIGDQLAVGKRQTLSWWRGSVIPARAQEFGLGLTRFTPGLDSSLFTNSVEQLVAHMRDRGAVALEHHWGLWYDRRRDDHQMIRRMNSDAWPPFYEQPWARSGQGQAWDGLSKYDLSRFNHWYFDRLAQFASAADESGLILIQQMYFQHNVLEAGAHWADFPWRPANCIQEVGFAEPPQYENRKRIFMADEFYDVSHPVRRELHTTYIRHCLDTLGQFSNVVFAVGEEYSGPTHFVKFWLDTIRKWSQDNDRDVLIMLSACRNVQEEILSSAEYVNMIDIIDVKYWWFTNEGALYDPPGGQRLAPRQQLREWKGAKSRSVDSLCLSVRDLKARFPQKAVTCSLPTDNPWKLLAAGCSLQELPKGTDQELLRDLVELCPQTEKPEWSLRSPNSESKSKHALIVTTDKLQTDGLGLHINYVDTKTGKLHSQTGSSEKSTTERNPSVVWVVDRQVEL